MKDDWIGILGGKRFPNGAHVFPIESPFDSSALSRFVSRVVEPGHCAAKVVVVDIRIALATEPGLLPLLEGVVERLRANGIIPVVVMRRDERLPAGSAARFPLVAGALSPAGEAAAIMAAAVRGKG